MNRNTALRASTSTTVRHSVRNWTLFPPKPGPAPSQIHCTVEARYVDMTTCRMTRTTQIRRAAAGAARAASRLDCPGTPAVELAASFKQSRAQGLAPRNTPSRTTPTLSKRQLLPRQLYNFSTVSLPTAHISSSRSISTMTSDFKQAPHKLLVIPGPIEFSDAGEYRSDRATKTRSETLSDERRARRGGGSA